LVLLAVFAQVGHLLFHNAEVFYSFGSSLGALGGALLGSYSLREIKSTLSNFYYAAFLFCFYGLVFSASLAVLLKHQRRVARRQRRRLQRRQRDDSGGGVGVSGCFGGLADDNGGGSGAPAAPESYSTKMAKCESGDVWGNSLSVKEIGDLAWGKFLVWAGFKPESGTGKTDDALSAEFLFAEFECQIDELLHKLDVISGCAPSAVSPPPLSGFPPAANSSTDAKFNSSGTASKSGASSELRQRHQQQQQQQSDIHRMDNQFAYNRDRDWAQLVDLGHLDTGALTDENDKDLRVALEYEIYRQLHLGPPVEESSNFITHRSKERVAAPSSSRPPLSGGGGGDQNGGGELLQLLGLDPSSVSSAAATELLLANFCSSMQMGNEADAFLYPQKGCDEGLYSTLIENDIPYHPPTFESFTSDIEVDIPYHGPSAGDRDSLQSDELSIPDWTTPQAPAPPRPTNQKTKKSNRTTNQHHHNLAPLEVEIPYHPPLEDFDEALGNVMVEVPSHILEDDFEEDEDDESVEMEIELCRVNEAYLVSPSSPTSRAKEHLPFEVSAGIHRSDSNRTKGRSRVSEPESNGRRAEFYSNAGRRLHKTRSRGKVKLLDSELPTTSNSATTTATATPADVYLSSRRDGDAVFASVTAPSSSLNCGRSGVSGGGAGDGGAPGGNRNLAFHASPTGQGREPREKETPC